MSWRVTNSFQRLSCLMVLPAAFALASCGGAVDGEGVTGPSAVVLSDDSPSADGVSASAKKAKKSKVLLCHKGKDKWVPPSAVTGHLRHGDSLGSCSAPVTCPCFSASDIQANASQCSGTLTPQCSVGDPYYLFLSCNPGGNVPPGFSLYQSSSSGATCERLDASGSFEVTNLTADEYQACVAAINDSGYCF